jgi:rhodanese-related sulfurtransferase
MRKRAYITVVLALAVCLVVPGLISAEKKKPKWPAVVGQYVAKAKNSVTTVSMERFKTAVDKKDYDLIVDVREPAEYARGHLPGAINIPRGLLEFKIWKRVGFPEKTDTSKKIYIHCKTGGRAALSARALKELGFTGVIAVDMKIADWKSAGYPIVNE